MNICPILPPLPNPHRPQGYTAYRGVASFPPGGLPLPRDTVRQVYGDGVRAGMYPLSDTQAYWFTCFNADEVRVGLWGGGVKGWHSRDAVLSTHSVHGAASRPTRPRPHPHPRRAPQAAPAPATPEAQREEALSFVRGWAWGIEDAIRASPLNTLSRSHVRDR
jgi:hypothetical protein